MSPVDHAEQDLFLRRYTNTPFDIIRRRRGWDQDFFDLLTARTTDRLPDIDRAVELIHEAISSGRRVTVLTDYDMDGVSAGLAAYAGLCELGAQASLIVPDYRGPRDVTEAKVREALRVAPDTGLIITCDVGINSNEGIDCAHAHGIPVVVADHHHELEPCRADAAVDPDRPGVVYAEPHICGAQVVLHILTAYAQRHSPEKAHAVELLRVFAGVGGLADVMPLQGQTRQVVRTATALLQLAVPAFPPNRWGGWDVENPDAVDPASSTLMSIVSHGGHDPRYQRVFYGLSLMLKHLGLAKKIRSAEDVDASFVGYTMAPMFNATRRIEGDMADPFQIFVPDQVAACRPGYSRTPDEAIAQVIANNELRKEHTRSTMAALDQVEQPYAPYIWFSEGPAGIKGLIASNISKTTHLPAVVLDPTSLTGSARAPGWASVIELVDALARPGLTAAGHQQACGIHASGLDDLDALHDAFEALLQQLPDAQRGDIEPDLHMIDIEIASSIPFGARPMLAGADCELPPSHEMIRLIEQLDAIGPFGEGFRKPSILITFQPKHSIITTMGTEGQHVKVKTPHGLELLWWNSTERVDEIAHAELVTVSVDLSTNTFMGNVRPQAIIGAVTTDQQIQESEL